MEDDNKAQASVHDRFEEASQAFEDRFKPVGFKKEFDDARQAHEDRFKPVGPKKELLDAFGGNDRGEHQEQALDTAKKTEFSEPVFHTYPII